MKTFKSSGAFKPFKELKKLLEKKSLKSAPSLPVGHAKKQVFDSIGLMDAVYNSFCFEIWRI